MHLGMSGSLSFGAATAEPGPHDHFDLVTARGTLRLTDPRRFGAVVWSPAADAAPAAKLLAGLGLEPFDARFDGAHLHAALRRRRVAVKTALLGGEIVVGAGNIYACEALVRGAASIRARAATASAGRAPRCSPMRCDRRWRARSSSAARPCATSATLTAPPASSSSRPRSTAAPASRACAAARRCGASSREARATFFCPVCQRR